MNKVLPESPMTLVKTSTEECRGPNKLPHKSPTTRKPCKEGALGVRTVASSTRKFLDLKVFREVGAEQRVEHLVSRSEC
jgi:hypothetical protein